MSDDSQRTSSCFADKVKRKALGAAAFAQMLVPPSAQSLATYAAAGGGGAFLTTSCSTPDEETPSQQNTPYAERGNAAVYYGEALDISLRNKLAAFSQAVVDPIQIPASVAPTSAIAYVSLTGINQGSYSPEFAAFRNAMGAADGYLKDASGAVVHDPSGANTWMVDLREPAAFDLMKNHIASVAQQFRGRVFLDAIDSATVLENQNPTLYAGLTDAAINLMQQVCAQVSGNSKKVVVNGGLFQRTTAGTDVLAAIAANADGMAMESQYRAPDATDYLSTKDWTTQRLTVAATAANAAGKAGLNVIAIDPCDGNYVDASCAAATYYNGMFKDITTATGLPMKASVYVGNMSFQHQPDIDGNAALRGQGLCL